MNIKFFSNQFFWLFLIIFLALLVRLYKIDSPIADWHSWRQADTAAVTRNFIEEGFNPFLPRGDDMSPIAEKSVPNLERFRFVEFPVYNIIVYPIYLIFGVEEKLHRLVSVFFSLGSIIFTFLITRRYLGKPKGLLASFIYAMLPFNIFFSRTTLPEPTFVFFALGMVYFVDTWINTGKKLFLGLFFSVIAFLIKPWAIFFVLPLIYSILKKEGNILKFKYLFFAIVVVLPFLIWRLWILQSPEGIPASNWLFNGDNIRFRPAFWWWIISERLGREILGATGLFLFLLGLLMRPKRNFFLHIWALSFGLYFIIFATGNVRHDYYQYIFMPVASVFIAVGFLSLIKGINNFIPRFWTIPLGLIFLPLTFYFTWIQISPLYNINNPSIIEAGKAADRILPKNSIVVTPFGGDSAFLYQVNRSGFPVTFLPINELVTYFGVTHFISINHDDKTNWVIRHFEVLEDNLKFVIADLTKIKVPLDPKDPEP